MENRVNLQLPAVVCAGETFRWSKISRESILRGRIANHLLTCEMPCSVEQVAKATKTNKKVVREVVQDLKKNGVLTESSFPKHWLLRLKVTP